MIINNELNKCNTITHINYIAVTIMNYISLDIYSNGRLMSSNSASCMIINAAPTHNLPGVTHEHRYIMQSPIHSNLLCTYHGSRKCLESAIPRMVNRPLQRRQCEDITIVYWNDSRFTFIMRP